MNANEPFHERSGGSEHTNDFGMTIVIDVEKAVAFPQPNLTHMLAMRFWRELWLQT